MGDPSETADRGLRILHVLRAPLGGLFRHVVDLTKEQVARGHQVGLVVDSLTCGEGAFANLQALEPLLALGVRKLPIRREPSPADVRNIAIVEAHARRLGVDILHGHGSKGGLYARAGAFFPLNQSSIRCYTPHGGSFNHVARPAMQALYMGVERMLAGQTDVLLFESVFIASRFRDRIGDTKALLRIVHNGIGPAEFVPVAPGADASDFVYVGELRSAKGIDTLIDAIAILMRKLRRPLTLKLVGSGPDQDKLREQAQRRGIAGQIVFTGVLPAREAFAQGRVLVVPSRAESMPYIVLEAVGAQIPIVATNVGGIGEIFGPYSDRLVVCDNPLVLAQAMERMLHLDPTLRQQQCEELVHFVSARFSIANMADCVVGGYRDALSQRGCAPPSAAMPVPLHP